MKTKSMLRNCSIINKIMNRNLCMHYYQVLIKAKLHILEMLTSKDWLLVFATCSLVTSELAVT